MSSSGKRGEGRPDWTGFSRARRFADGLLLLQSPSVSLVSRQRTGTAVRGKQSAAASRFRLPRSRAARFI